MALFIRLKEGEALLVGDTTITPDRRVGLRITGTTDIVLPNGRVAHAQGRGGASPSGGEAPAPAAPGDNDLVLMPDGSILGAGEEEGHG